MYWCAFGTKLGPREEYLASRWQVSLLPAVLLTIKRSLIHFVTQLHEERVLRILVRTEGCGIRYPGVITSILLNFLPLFQ